MTQIEKVYTYLTENYELNEPIFLSEIQIEGVKSSSVRPQIKKLVEDGRLNRYDTGIYYLPKPSKLPFGTMLRIRDVIEKKYLMENGKRCGYMSGLMFANQMGLTTQVSMVYEIYTNKATTDYRETRVGNNRLIVRKPYVTISDENVAVLQFLDLLKEVTDISELTGEELTKRLIKYMKKIGLTFDDLKQYLPHYPDRIYRNMFVAGLLNGVVT